jgi:glycosyltransferase involved in cell wall biosynthesis
MKNAWKKSLSLVVPAHNAENSISNSIIEYTKIFYDFDEFEIIVVCNACSDNTFEVVKKLEPEYPIKIINIPHRGKGNALRRGFDKAKYELIGFLDSDNPFSLEKIKKMVYSLEYYDVAIATKYLRGSLKNKRGINDSQLRRMIALGGQIFTRIIFELKFRDTQAGAKFFRKNVWKSIRKNIVCVGFEFDIEILYKSKKNGFKIIEFYTPLVKYEKFSTVRLRYLIGMIYRLIKMRISS